jgi:hypothetical protein
MILIDSKSGNRLKTAEERAIGYFGCKQAERTININGLRKNNSCGAGNVCNAGSNPNYNEEREGSVCAFNAPKIVLFPGSRAEGGIPESNTKD